ncbi:MAG: DsrE family protein [Gammaproteobacteria bacterium]|nr:DsrE family protein [Gammaproteobacteria bacterium]
MRHHLTFVLMLTLAFTAFSTRTAMANDGHEDKARAPDIFVFVTAEDNQTRGMAMVLARQMLDQGANLRVLLCGPGGELAIRGLEEKLLAPRGITPQQLLRGLMGDGVQVDVCAIFLPNTQYENDDLLEGIGVAMPPEVAEFMLREGVRYFTF